LIAIMTQKPDLDLDSKKLFFRDISLRILNNHC